MLATVSVRSFFYRRRCSRLGNVLTQAWIIHEINHRWAVARGAAYRATGHERRCNERLEASQGVVVRAMLP